MAAYAFLHHEEKKLKEVPVLVGLEMICSSFVHLTKKCA
jgi:hypothetical protein